MNNRYVTQRHSVHSTQAELRTKDRGPRRPVCSAVLDPTVPSSTLFQLLDWKWPDKPLISKSMQCRRCYDSASYGLHCNSRPVILFKPWGGAAGTRGTTSPIFPGKRCIITVFLILQFRSTSKHSSPFRRVPLLFRITPLVYTFSYETQYAL